MKKLFLSALVFTLGSGLAFAAPDYKGHQAFIKANKEKIRTMEKECRNSKSPKEHLKKCNELMKFKVEAECRYGISPDACKALDEIQKVEKK